MNRIVKKILIWTGATIGVLVLGYFALVGYVIYTFSSGCGMDDGPFHGRLIEQRVFSDSVQTISINGGVLLLENRPHNQPPILALKENDRLVWVIELDVRENPEYKSCLLWEISNVEVVNSTDPISLDFIGHWTYGAERGIIEIDREDGENSFCLSW